MRRRASLAALALVSLPAFAGGFMLYQGHVPADAARVFAQVFSRIERDGIDSVSADALYEKAARGLVKSLGDPYADLYSPAELASFSRNSLGNAYGGIGVLVEDQLGSFMASKVYPNTPAEAAGVQVGDRFVSVDGMNTSGKRLEDVTSRLTGRPGTNVTVTFTRAGVTAPIVTKLVRAVVHVPAVPYALVMEQGIGYVPLVRFSDSSGEEVRSAIDQLASQGARSFILDLRGNGGGSFDQALAISNLFLDRGKSIVSVRSRSAPTVESVAETSPRQPRAPLVVLTDGYTASASEIVAGALQDHDRAVVLGTTSFGKGLVQTLFPLEGGWALKMTTAKWYTPSGRSIQRERVLREDGRLVEVVPDSLETDSVRKARPAFKSDAGRLVYGGGGITPDLIIASDTITTPEQKFLRALAPKAQASSVAMSKLAFELKREVKAPSFEVTKAWRDTLYARLTRVGVTLDRAAFDAARPLVDRMLEARVSSITYGDSLAFRRGVTDDAQLVKAIGLLRGATTQADVLARIPSGGGDGRSE